MSYLGADVSANQPPTLPWDAWVSSGLQVAIVQTWHADHAEPLADIHLAHALLARVPHIGAYSWLGHALPKQCASFLATLNPAYTFCALDVEQANVDASDVLTWCSWFDAHSRLPLYLYGNNALAAIVAAHPELKRYKVWYAAYPTFPQPCLAPPFDQPRNVPASLAGRVAGWQYAGNNGVWPPYGGAIDRSEWYEIHGATMPTMPAVMVPRGSLIAIHAINPGDTLERAKEAVAAGAPYSAIKILNDAAALAEVKQASPTTWCYLRYFNPADDSLQGLDDWSIDNEIAWCTRVLNKIYSQITAEQCRWVDWACAWNEEDPPGQWGYKKLGETFLRLGQMNEARKATGQTYVKLAFGCLAQGTPELWEIDELVDTGLFAWMHDHFYSWDVHEGWFPNQPLEQGIGDSLPSDPAHNHPGGGDVPAIPGSGSGNFRFVWTFERRLRPLGQLVPLLIGEFYPQKPGQLDSYLWYDDRASAFEYLTGFALYNKGHTDDWPDLTPDYLALRQHQIDIRNRINGGLMPNVSDADFAALLAGNQAEAVILAKYKPATKHTMSTHTNQWVIDLFHATFGGYAELDAVGGVNKLVALGRQVGYVGPALEDTTLTAAQVAALVAKGA